MLGSECVFIDQIKNNNNSGSPQNMKNTIFFPHTSCSLIIILSEVIYNMFHILNCGFEIKSTMITAVMNGAVAS